MFASQSSKTIPMPGQPDRQVTIRKLSRRSFKQAMVLMSEGKGIESDELILREGVVAWTGDPAMADGWIDDLSPDAGQTLCEEVLRFTSPVMFATSKADAEALEKNGSTVSPATSPDEAQPQTNG